MNLEVTYNYINDPRISNDAKVLLKQELEAAGTDYEKQMRAFTNYYSLVYSSLENTTNTLNKLHVSSNRHRINAWIAFGAIWLIFIASFICAANGFFSTGEYTSLTFIIMGLSIMIGFLFGDSTASDSIYREYHNTLKTIVTFFPKFKV